MRSFKPDFCFVVINGDTLPDQNILRAEKATGMIKTPTGRYIFFQGKPYDLKECQRLTALLGGVPGIRRIYDYSRPKESMTQRPMWERRGQPVIRLSKVIGMSTVEKNDFIVYFDKHYITLTFKSNGAAIDARRSLINACQEEKQ